MAERREIWDTWKSIYKEVEEEVKKLEPRERALTRAFYEQVENEILKPLEQIEKRIEKGNANPPLFADLFKSLLSNFYRLPSTGPSVEGESAIRLLNRIWEPVILAITSFLERKAKEVGVASWSTGTSFGLPTGISATITVNFRLS